MKLKVNEMVINATPWELHQCCTYGVWVKREDLSSPPPGPSFSKIRGVRAHIESQLNALVPPTRLAVLDSIHSKAGWGVSWLARAYGLPVTVFYPHLKAEPEGHLREYQQICKDLGAELYPLQATKSSVLWYKARKILKETEPTALLFPNGLRLEESIEGTAQELICSTPERLLKGTWVVSASSGTLAAGVVKGLQARGFTGKLIVHLGYSRSIKEMENYLAQYGANVQLNVIDEGYGYADSVDIPVSFPCNPYYDMKAWKWLSANIKTLELPIVFWNIGA